MHVETGRHLYGGARQVLLLIRGLMERGHRCTLVCPADSDIAAEARQSGFDVHAVPMRGALDIGFVWVLARWLRRIQPDLVHVHSRRGGDTLGGLAAGLASVPAVLSRRVDSADVPGLGRLKYTRYRRIIAISSCIRDRLAMLGVPSAKCRLVHSAVTAATASGQGSRSAFLDEFALPADAFPIAVVAQLIPRKGHRVFLDAMARLRGEHPQLRAILFGVGSLQASLVARVTELGLDEQVCFAGFRTDLDRLIGHFELLVHPADREGLGISVLEAQAAGVPVVGFRTGGLVEAVADGETGVLVPPGDVRALTAAIHQLVEDAELRQQLAAAGPAHVAAKFGVDAMVAGNLAVYCEIVSGSNEIDD